MKKLVVTASEFDSGERMVLAQQSCLEFLRKVPADTFQLTPVAPSSFSP